MTHVSHEVLSLCRTELCLQGGISRATQEKIGSEACGPADVVAHCYFQCASNALPGLLGCASVVLQSSGTLIKRCQPPESPSHSAEKRGERQGHGCMLAKVLDVLLMRVLMFPCGRIVSTGHWVRDRLCSGGLTRGIFLVAKCSGWS